MKNKKTLKTTINSSTEKHDKGINLYAQISHLDQNFIPLVGSKSRQVLDLLILGTNRSQLNTTVPNFHGAPLQNLEGKRYGYWLIERYVDEHGSKCLKLNERHLSGCDLLDSNARVIMRKERAENCFKKNNSEIGRISIVRNENSDARKRYFISLGEAANDCKKLT